jgi:hypothetical protein
VRTSACNVTRRASPAKACECRHSRGTLPAGHAPNGVNTPNSDVWESSAPAHVRQRAACRKFCYCSPPTRVRGLQGSVAPTLQLPSAPDVQTTQCWLHAWQPRPPALPQHNNNKNNSITVTAAVTGPAVTAACTAPPIT